MNTPSKTWNKKLFFSDFYLNNHCSQIILVQTWVPNDKISHSKSSRKYNTRILEQLFHNILLYNHFYLNSISRHLQISCIWVQGDLANQHVTYQNQYLFIPLCLSISVSQAFRFVLNYCQNVFTISNTNALILNCLAFSYHIILFNLKTNVGFQSLKYSTDLI